MRPEKLARLTVENYLKKDGEITLPEKLTDVEVDKAGAFVSIKTLEDSLRGCVGTILPTRDSVVEEIAGNAVASASRDNRFPPVKKSELDNLKFSVDILHQPERVNDIKELDPKKYGIIVSSKSGKQALLLPDLEGLDTVEKQVSACMRKAGMSMDERVFVQRFKVDRYSE